MESFFAYWPLPRAAITHDSNEQSAEIPQNKIHPPEARALTLSARKNISVRDSSIIPSTKTKNIFLSSLLLASSRWQMSRKPRLHSRKVGWRAQSLYGQTGAPVFSSCHNTVLCALLTWHNVNLNPFYLSLWIINGGSHCPWGKRITLEGGKRRVHETAMYLTMGQVSRSASLLPHNSPDSEACVFCQFWRLLYFVPINVIWER